MPSACAPPLPMKLPVNGGRLRREGETRCMRTDQSLSERVDEDNQDERLSGG